MSANITIEQTPTGWHVESGEEGQRFTADLGYCGCDGKGKTFLLTTPCVSGYHVPHVRLFLKRLAATYPAPRPSVPEVPFDGSKVPA